MTPTQHYADARETALLNAILREQDRQREIKRQRSQKALKALADSFRKPPADPNNVYHNSDGYPVGIHSLPISLC